MPGPPLADVFARIWRLHQAGEHEESRRCFNRLLPVLELSSRTPDTFLYVQKELLRRAGIFSSYRLRRPCEPPDPLLAGEIDDAVSGMDAVIVNS